MPATHTRKPRFKGPPARSYAELVATLPPRPLHDRVDYDNAVEMAARLVGHELNRDQSDYLDALDTFIEQYEARHGDTQPDTDHLSGLDVLRHLIDEHGMSGADLSRLLGASRTLGPLILRGERSITADHARTLGRHFALDPGMFIR